MFHLPSVCSSLFSSSDIHLLSPLHFTAISLILGVPIIQKLNDASFFMSVFFPSFLKDDTNLH